MPIRKIPSSYRSITGRVHHYSVGTTHAHESALERDLFVLLDAMPGVASFEEQPVFIPYRHPNGRWMDYPPDVFICFQRGPGENNPPDTLAEAKYMADLRANARLWRAKFLAAHRFARERGWRFRIYTERRIRLSPVLLANLKFLGTYRRPAALRPAVEPEMGLLLEALRAAGGPLRGDELLARCGPTAAQRQAVFAAALWTLVTQGRVGTDLRAAPLNLTRPLWAVHPGRSAGLSLL